MAKATRILMGVSTARQGAHFSEFREARMISGKILAYCSSWRCIWKDTYGYANDGCPPSLAFSRELEARMCFQIPSLSLAIIIPKPSGLTHHRATKQNKSQEDISTEQ
jgi:hypothetical protein